MKPKYGCSSYYLSCSVSLVLGTLGASILILVLSYLIGHRDFRQLINYSPLMTTGLPLTTLVLAITIHFFIFTPAQAYWLIKWYLQDYWQSGKEIWKEKDG